MDTTDIKEFPDFGGPPELSIPDGTVEERKAWFREMIDKRLGSGLPFEMTPEKMAESVKRRGLERLERLRNAA
jgi:hypothetical protein